MLPENKFLSRFFAALFLIGFALLASRSATPSFAQETGEVLTTGGLKKVTLCLQWLPQAQFAGYYAARDTGIYSRYGLDVTIINGGPTSASSKALEEKKADFCTMFLSTALTLKENGLPSVNIAQFSKKSSIVFVAKKSSNIKQISDLNGKKIGLWISDSRTIPNAFIQLHKINAAIIDITSSPDIFLYDGIDAINAMRYHEYYDMISAGLEPSELTTFPLSDNGFDIMEDGLYCLSDTFSRDPKLCSDFVKASIEGWKYAFENRENAVGIVLNYAKAAHQRANLAGQRYMLDRMFENFCPDGGTEAIGRFAEEEYKKASALLISAGIIKSAPEYKDFIKNCGDIDVKK